MAIDAAEPHEPVLSAPRWRRSAPSASSPRGRCSRRRCAREHAADRGEGERRREAQHRREERDQTTTLSSLPPRCVADHQPCPETPTPPPRCDGRRIAAATPRSPAARCGETPTMRAARRRAAALGGQRSSSREPSDPGSGDRNAPADRPLGRAGAGHPRRHASVRSSAGARGSERPQLPEVEHDHVGTDEEKTRPWIRSVRFEASCGSEDLRVAGCGSTCPVQAAEQERARARHRSPCCARGARRRCR